MTVILKLIHALLFILMSNILAVASFDCNAIYINGEEGESPGKCTTFPECPILFDILKSPYKTLKEVKLLQRLTCQPDNDNPTVCCALEDIKSETNNTYYAIGSSKQTPPPTPNDSIVFGKDENESQQQRRKPTTSSHTTVNEVHPNFRLLPPLTKCSNAVFRDRIIGGEETSILDYPWLARIGYRSLEDNTIKYLCGATIINEKYFLTAAHCTQEVNKDEYEPVHVRVSETDVNCDEIYGCSKPRDFLIEKIIPHPNYNKRDKSNDLGLIRVTKEISFDIFACPVCLPFVEEYELSKEDLDPRLEKYLDTDKLVGYVAGYGKTRWTDYEGSPTLQHVTLPMLSHQQCKKSYQNHTRVSINTKQLCAGGQRGRDSCGGDSGGGLFIYEKVPIAAKVTQTKPFQIGIVSFGPTHCGIGNLPGVYSSVYDYKDWILDHLEP